MLANRVLLTLWLAFDLGTIALRWLSKTLYDEGHARNFVVAGVGAQGCLSSTLSTFLNMTRDFRGCAIAVDDICKNSRQQTLAMLNELHELHPDANYTFVDFYAATHYIIDHAEQFGTIL